MNYYAFISGLPDLILDEHKKVYSTREFNEELKQLLSLKDKRIINKLFLKYDNDNLLSYLKHGEENMRFNDLANYPQEVIIDMVEMVKDEDRKWNKKYHNYLQIFIQDYLTHDETPKIFWEDHLSTLYYNFLLNKTHNLFLKEWCELNMNIRNILTALSARREGIEYNYLIVGNNDVATWLRTSQNPTHSISEFIDYYESIREIDEITDLIQKEQRIDEYLWEWIDEQTFFHYFDVEKIMGYLFKLQIIERWKMLDAEKGSEIFKNIVNNLKNSAKLHENFDIIKR
ncbi:MAG: DUF2764 domain-containing protein [Bacteroidetes bacterium]|nr:DUF2764 domain-containing protein [Bacteroidota bacterium]MCL1968882.1 DUF2764 domain-containing protein [Bacteroidota bacterium]MCL1968997.1 DUF2764 domain-containing protein [Bacteroidota bacterium]